MKETIFGRRSLSLSAHREFPGRKKARLFSLPFAVMVFVLSFSIEAWGVSGSVLPPDITSGQCATFDTSTSLLHIPCFDFGPTSFFVDLGLTPLGLELQTFGDNGSAGDLSVCAAFDFQSKVLHVPCFTFAGVLYFVDLGLISSDPVRFDLQDYGILTPQCTYSISPAGQSFGAVGGSGTVTVTAISGCAWTAASNAAWLGIITGEGSGDGSVSYSVGRNISTSQRTGTISIAGQTFTATQAGAISPSPSPSPGFDGTYSAGITTVTSSGTTTVPGTFTVTHGNVSNSAGTFTGTVGATGLFTGTSKPCSSCDLIGMSGTFSLTGSFTIADNSPGPVHQTIVAHKIK